MVVVVPALSQGDERKDEAVAAVVIGFETSITPDVRHGIDAGGSVEQESGADEKSPNQHLRAIRTKARCELFQNFTQAKQGNCKKEGDQNVETIQENQLRELGQILDSAVIGREILGARDPADVSPNEPMLAR